MDDLYRDVLSDSVLNNVGLARGLQERMCDIGLPLSLQQPHLPRINEESVAAQLRHRQLDSLKASLGVDPRTCRSEGAAICTYWRCAGSDAQTVSKGIACVLVFSVMPPHPRGHMSFCAFGWMGCHTLPSVTGRRAGIPRSRRATMPAMYARCGRRETFGF